MPYVVAARLMGDIIVLKMHSATDNELKGQFM